MKLKRTLLGTVALALAVTTGAAADPTQSPTAAAADSTRVPTVAQAEGEPVYTFVSAPDFLNADIADVSARPGWDPADGNSINDAWRAALKLAIDDMASYNPDSVFVAGDLVEGHWGEDTDNTGIFGPVGTYENKIKALYNAGNTYYPQWMQRWEASGIDRSDIYTAVGDHEIGDNDWLPGEFKYKAIPDFKRVYAKNTMLNRDGTQRFANRPFGTDFADTSYATWLAPGIMLVSVDVFNKKPDGVSATVVGGQLKWLEQVLATTTSADTVIVQAHTPALGPVRTYGSSGMMLEGGGSSQFWQLLERRKVDLFLSGEVHATTARQNNYTLQISHGGLMHNTKANYIVANVYADGTIDIDSRTFSGTYTKTPELWAADNRRPPANIKLNGPAPITGELTLQDGRVSVANGDLDLNPYVARKNKKDSDKNKKKGKGKGKKKGKKGGKRR